MSKNIAALARRKGLDDGLFERIREQKSHQQKQQIAKDFLVGDAIVQGSASFYDFIEGENAQKKAYVCNGSSCLCAGTQPQVLSGLLQHFHQDDIGHVACLGRCHENASFQISGENYSGDDIHQLDRILDQQAESGEDYAVVALCDNPILTAKITDTANYYQLIEHLITQQSREQILQSIIESGLRGRGGAGFPTGIKWKACADAIGDEKYIVCNADEGDPGAFSDRYLLERRPHAVLFGMYVAGYLVGARTGVLYIRDEYPDSIDLCEQAIEEFEQLKLSYSFRFKIVRGAGAYICGEETALLRSIEGQRPMVSTRPPFPVTEGLFGKPTALNNVETFASIHWILEHGAQAFNARGNRKSTGTKLLSLDSVFKHPGIYEVDMNTSLSKVIEAAGGFSKPVKALHIGGPLGGLVPVSKIDDLTIDFESFHEQGFLLGHASILGIPESMPLIEYMEHLFDFTAAESCGKCFPCRLGATRGKEMVRNAIDQKQALDSELLTDLLETMELGSLCALGGGVPLPIKNILQHFSDEVRPFFQLKNQSSIPVTEVH